MWTVVLYYLTVGLTIELGMWICPVNQLTGMLIVMSIYFDSIRGVNN